MNNRSEISCRVLPADEDEFGADSVAASGSLLQGFTSLPSWLLALTFVAFAFGVDSFTTFAPLYCEVILGMDPVTANFDASLVTVGMIIGGLAMAFVLTKVNTFKARMRVMLVAVILTVLTYPLMYMFQLEWVVPFMLITGIILQVFPSIAFTIAPETARGPAFVGATMGIIALSQSLGIGGVISGAVIEQFGYGGMLYLLGFVGVVELVAVISLVLAMNKRLKPKQNS